MPDKREYDDDEQVYDVDGEALERRHDGYHRLANAVTTQNLRLAELTERVRNNNNLIRTQHEDMRREIVDLHEKVNKHERECGLVKRVGRLEIAIASRTGFWAAVVALGGIIGAAVWSILKTPLGELAADWVKHGGNTQ